ncbi:MAG: hypothetical protein K9K32_00250 [Halanaerobiales bacterium]|nr:hypothetical protein [Halanaerobiales bacterium]
MSKLEHTIDKIFYFILYRVICPRKNWKISQIFKITIRYTRVKRIIKNGEYYV